MYFDVRAAKLLKPGQHMVIDGCPGLRLAARDSRLTWIYRYKDGSGKMKQMALGFYATAGGMSFLEAANQCKELRLQREQGIDPRIERERIKKAELSKLEGAYTVAKLVQDFIMGPLKDSRAESGFKAARNALETALSDHPEFASTAAVDVTRGVAFEVIDAKKATPTAAAKLRSLFGSAWENAHDSGALDGDAPNWWRQLLKGKLKSKGKIIGGKHEGKKRRVLLNAEVTALLQWLSNMHENGQDGTILYLWTCTRGSEIFGMRPEHFQQEDETLWWTVPKERTKNQAEEEAVDLRVPLYGRALEVVRRRLENVGPSGWLFTDKHGEQYSQHQFSTYIYDLQPYSKKSARRAGAGLVLPVTHWTPHNLRRTARTMLAQLGCLNEVAEAIVGHMPTEIVATYNAHSYDAERQEWLLKLANHLESLVG